MDLDNSQRSGLSLRALAAAGALALAACGEPTPFPPTPQPAAPQAQAAPAPIVAPAPAPAPAPEQADKALAAQVQDALRAALGSLADGIDVTASGGTVTLWGTVPEIGKRGQALRAAFGVAGVMSVKDHMAIVAGS